MVPLQALVVRQDSGGREQKRGTPKRTISRLRGEQDGRKANTISPEPLAKLPVAGKLFRCYQKMAALRLQLPDLFVHLADQFRIARGERNDDRLRVLAEHPEDELLERSLQRNSLQRNSMVVASPAVLSLAFGLALY